MTTPPLDLDSMRAHAVAAENLKAGAHVTNAELLALLDRVEAAEAKVAAVRTILEGVRARGELIGARSQTGSLHNERKHARGEGYREAAQLGLNTLGGGA